TLGSSGAGALLAVEGAGLDSAAGFLTTACALVPCLAAVWSEVGARAGGGVGETCANAPVASASEASRTAMGRSGTLPQGDPCAALGVPRAIAQACRIACPTSANAAAGPRESVQIISPTRMKSAPAPANSAISSRQAA